MQVRMLIHVSGSHDGEDWPEAGTVIAVSDAEGADLVANGYAEKAGKASGKSPTSGPDVAGTKTDDPTAAVRKSTKT